MNYQQKSSNIFEHCSTEQFKCHTINQQVRETFSSDLFHVLFWLPRARILTLSLCEIGSRASPFRPKETISKDAGQLAGLRCCAAEISSAVLHAGPIWDPGPRRRMSLLKWTMNPHLTAGLLGNTIYAGAFLIQILPSIDIHRPNFMWIIVNSQITCFAYELDWTSWFRNFAAEKIVSFSVVVLVSGLMEIANQVVQHL